MNITIGSNKIALSQFIRARYIGALGGLVLVAGSLMIGAPWRHAGGGAPTVSSAVAREALTLPTQPNRVVYVLTNAATPADQGVVLFGDMDTTGVEVRNVSIETLADEQAFIETAGEAMLAGTNFQIVDARGR